MGNFMRKQIALGVASTAGWVVGAKLWALGSFALPQPMGDGETYALAGVVFVAGAAVFVWLYVLVNAKLEEYLGG